MNLNMFDEDDEPLFQERTDNDSTEKQKNRLNLEEYNTLQENGRKTKVLEFCFKSSKWILLLIAFLIVCDMIAQANGLDSTIVKDCLSLVTYSVTAALGFMFGSNSK